MGCDTVSRYIAWELSWIVRPSASVRELLGVRGKKPTHCSWVQNHSSLFHSESKSESPASLICLSASYPNSLLACSWASYTELAASRTLKACFRFIANELVAFFIWNDWIPLQLQVLSEMSLFKAKLILSTQVKSQHPYSILHILFYFFLIVLTIFNILCYLSI